MAASIGNFINDKSDGGDTGNNRTASIEQLLFRPWGKRAEGPKFARLASQECFTDVLAALGNAVFPKATLAQKQAAGITILCGWKPQIGRNGVSFVPGQKSFKDWRICDENKTIFRAGFAAGLDPLEMAEQAKYCEMPDSWRIFFEEEAKAIIAERQITNTEVNTLPHDLLVNTEETENLDQSQNSLAYQEGKRKWRKHFIAERNKEIVAKVKASRPWICEICSSNFSDKYGVDYIEAHHKTPLAAISGIREVVLSDFALLCPNCHKATHIYMNNKGLTFDQIKTKLGAFVKKQ